MTIRKRSEPVKADDDDRWLYTNSTRHFRRYVIVDQTGGIAIDGIHGEAIARRIVIEHNKIADRLTENLLNAF